MAFRADRERSLPTVANEMTLARRQAAFSLGLVAHTESSQADQSDRK